MKRAAFYTLGCKLNFAETSTIARALQAEGYQKVDFNDEAEVYIINTCSVTDNADKECRYLIRQLRKRQNEAVVCITGCYAQLKPHEIAQIEGVDLVLGSAEKFLIADYLKSFERKEKATVHSCEISEALQFHSSYSIGDRTRAFLKIQDGCDYTCSYCTIPLARGESRSDKLENVLKQAKSIADKGIKEIVLTGVNTGDYGKGEFGNKKHNHTFTELVQALDEVDGISRIRISSIEPNLLKNELIDFVSVSKKFVPHFHIPLQSGSDYILGKMRRRYQTALYRERVDRIKSVMPNACIGVDLITGFPGESEEHFKETCDFISQLDISYLHVFTYSERANTDAYSMEGRVPVRVRNERTKILRILSARKKEIFYRSQAGKKLSVLWESENKNGFMEGYSENYIRVKTTYRADLVNLCVPVVVGEFDGSQAMNAHSIEFADAG